MNDYYNMLGFCCNRLTELGWFCSPRTFSDSVVNIEKSVNVKNASIEHIIVLDRNIFSRLNSIITEGNTKQGSIQDIAILIVWCAMENVKILPYYALNELATGINSEEKAQIEYNLFSQLFDKVGLLTWMSLAIGVEKENKCTLKPTIFPPKSDTVFNECSIDYLMNYSAMLHFVYVYRTEKSNIEKFEKFFAWYYEKSKVSRYVEVYVCSVLSQIDGFKATKNINSNILDNVIKGCQNQARDLCYLTELSIDRIPHDKYEPVLVSDDEMLKNIFSIGCFNTQAIRIFENNAKNDKKRISEWINNLLLNHREFITDDYKMYYENLIVTEIEQLKKII